MSNANDTGTRRTARAVAELLSGSWRVSPPPLRLARDELDSALAIVGRTSAAALAWWRLRDTEYAALPEVEAMHDAYRYAALQAHVQELRLSAVFDALRAASVEPILLKGWDVARLYSRSESRPYEDIDLIVRPGDEARAQAALGSNGTTGAIVDFFHAEISVFDSGDWDTLYARSRLVRLAEKPIRVLSPEDHLRAICLHGLKHCFSNPLWLCDIGACVEATGSDFDWETCFGSTGPQDQWIECALGLARDVLACELPPPAAERVQPLPRWLEPVVFDTWIRWATVGLDKRWAMRELLENPVGGLGLVARRWPNQLLVKLKRRAHLTDDPLWLQRWGEFAYLFDPKRVVQAIVRSKPERSTP